MSGSPSFFQKYELPLFALLAYALSWWSAPFANGAIMPHGPAAAAAIVLAVTAGRRGLGEWWRRVSNWRAPLVWYIAGPAIILGYHVAAYAINRLAGAQAASAPSLAAGTALQLLLLGGWWEEPGWSGYLLPKLQKRFASLSNGLLVAALVTGVFRAIWHLPLFLYGHIFWFDIFIFSIAFQLIIAWLFNRSGGSVPVVMLFHYVSNLMGSVTGSVFTGGAHVSYYALFMGGAGLVALVLVWRGQFKSGLSMPEPQPGA